MATIRKTITLSDTQDAWIKRQIAEGGFTNDSEYIRDLVRRDQEGQEKLSGLRQAIAEGLDPSIYSHPIGLHGHGAGTPIGFWDNQHGDPRGEYILQPNTAWSIELTSYSAVPEWGGQVVDFRSEEDAFFDGKTVRFLDGRQTELTLIPSD